MSEFDNPYKPSNIHPPELRDIAGNRIRRAIDIIREPGAALEDRKDASNHIKRSVFNNRRQMPWGDPEFIRWPRLTAMLDHLGLPAEEVVAHWEASYGNARWEQTHWVDESSVGASKLHSIFESNVYTMLHLETARPGSTRVLADQFGIHNFIRFRTGNYETPPQQLIDQYDQRDEVGKPYGLVLAPYDDHNGAYSEADYKIWNVRKNLDDKIAIRGYEFEGYRGPRGLKATLEQAQNKYHHDDGTDGSASFGIIHAHSSGFGLQLTRFGSNSFDITDPLFSEPTEDTGDEEQGWRVFSKDATVVFGSCSTGVPGGLANHLAHRLEITTIGPDDVTGINQITAEDSTPIELNADYTTANTVKYLPNAPMQDVQDKDLERYQETILFGNSSYGFWCD